MDLESKRNTLEHWSSPSSVSRNTSAEHDGTHQQHTTELSSKSDFRVFWKFRFFEPLFSLYTSYEEHKRTTQACMSRWPKKKKLASDDLQLVQIHSIWFYDKRNLNSPFLDVFGEVRRLSISRRGTLAFRPTTARNTSVPQNTCRRPLLYSTVSSFYDQIIKTINR